MMGVADMPRDMLTGDPAGVAANEQRTQAFGTTEQMLASSTQASAFFQGPNAPPAASMLQFPDGFGQDESAVERLSRSLNCLGLATKISDEYMDRIDEEPTPLAQTQKGKGSRSSTDMTPPTAFEDVFSSMGGLELEQESVRSFQNLPQVDQAGSPVDRSSQFKIGVHPSRTLLVSSVNKNMSDEHLKAVFETFGDVQTLQTEYKAHGLVLVSFYDLRAAFNAKRELQSRTLADQMLQVQFSASGTSFGNFGEGTILLFNVDSHLDSKELAQIFSTYGDVKRIQEVPDKVHHKLIEFYDIRSANLAMQAINRAVVAGTQNQPDDQTEGLAGLQQAGNPQAMGSGGSGELLDQPTAHSWDASVSAASRMKSLLAMGGMSSAEELFGTGVAQGSPSTQCDSSNPFQSSAFGTVPMVKSNSALGLQSLGSTVTMATSKVPAVPQLASGALPLTPQLAKGLRIPDSTTSLGNRVYNRLQAPVANPVAVGSIPGMPDTSLLNAQLKNLSSQISPRVLQAVASGLPQTMLTNPGSPAHSMATHQRGARSGLSNSTSVGSGLDIYSQQSALNSVLAGLQQRGLLGSSVGGQPVMGRAGPGVRMQSNSARGAVWGQQGAAFPTPQNPPSQTAPNVQLYEAIAKLQESGVSASAIPGLLAGANVGTNQYLQAAVAANAAQLLHQVMGSSVLPGLMHPAASSGVDLAGLSKSASSPALNPAQEEPREQARDHRSGGRLSRRNVDPVLEAERRAQQQRLYALDMDRVRSGEDKRTTLMIKNIPNKYTQKMLLAAVDETLKGSYDFFYLPIDFKNKCNVGYGFVNMMTPMDIIPLYERFHNKKWERFNSEKVCCITYARIQGKAALVNHFQNSSLMHEDKKHRPVLFTSDGPTVGDPEPFPVGPNVRPRISIRERDFRSREKGGGYWGA